MGSVGNDVAVRYTWCLPDGRDETFEVTLDPHTGAATMAPPDDLPAWTRLEYEQCTNCPLAPDEHPHCPAAARLARLVKTVERIYSYEEVDVIVETAERRIRKRTSVQAAVGSLMGLVMASSGCPNLTFFRPMARFHLPFASPEETLFRATSSYLLTQYVGGMFGREPDFDLEGLARIYQEVQTVNQAFAERLRQASRADAAVNALVSLDVLAQVLPMAIEDQLTEIQDLFRPFWGEG